MAVAEGRDIAGTINRLLGLPFCVKVATRDCHPIDHVSFATSHQAPDNKPFESRVKIANPDDAAESCEIRVWPPHCVQGSRGAEIIPELDVAKFDHIVNKGRDKRVEALSGFADVFGRRNTEAIDVDLTSLLRSHQITDVYVVGLAGDYCVRSTAIDAREAGFEVFLIEDGIRSIDPGRDGWQAAVRQMQEDGIHIVKVQGQEVMRVQNLDTA